jgi:hypothetical protein
LGGFNKSSHCSCISEWGPFLLLVIGIGRPDLALCGLLEGYLFLELVGYVLFKLGLIVEVGWQNYPNSYSYHYWMVASSQSASCFISHSTCQAMQLLHTPPVLVLLVLPSSGLIFSMVKVWLRPACCSKGKVSL